MNIRELMIREEGLSLELYRCPAGRTTIGVGRNLSDRGISEAEALYFLDNDIREAEEFIVENVPVYRELGEVRQAVLVSMYHCLGPRKFLGFEKTLWCIGKFMFEQAAQNLLRSRWQRQLQKYAPGKETRVERLAEMLRTNEWPGE